MLPPWPHLYTLILLLVGASACDRGGEVRRPGNDVDSAGDSAPPIGPCPTGMVEVDDFCMDAFESPNLAGGLPLVMYTFVEAEAWCGARDKRLCFDDEWERACAGDAGLAYPYGDTHDPGVCNDEEVWITYDQGLLNGWPGDVSTPGTDTLADLLAAARAAGPGATAAADHVEALYQAEGSGQNTGCAGQWPVFDLVGNVEEWTRRRDGGQADFHGNLKGRYWAEDRTCQSDITSHGDYFRFYEIGFRCCADQRAE